MSLLCQTTHLPSPNFETIMQFYHPFEKNPLNLYNTVYFIAESTITTCLDLAAVKNQGRKRVTDLLIY